MHFRNETLGQKIWAIGPTDDCVPWDGAVNYEGYPMMHYQGRTQPANRVSYQIHVGPIPRNHWVIRTCGNIRCLNPKHLELTKAGGPMMPAPTKAVSEPTPDETPSAPVIDTIVHDNETNEWHAFYWENQKMVKYGVFDEYDRAAYALSDYLKESS